MKAIELVGIMTGDGAVTVGDPARLRSLEERISAVGRAVIDAGAALRCIRDERLYKLAGFDIFDDYCQAKWELNREQVDRMIRVSAVADVLATAGKPLPKSEYPLRVLAPLLTSPIGLVKVWELAEAEASASDGRVTGALLDRIIREGSKGAVIVDPAPVEPAPEPAVLEPAPAGGAGGADVDWDAVIRSEVESDKVWSAGGGAGSGDDSKLTDAQRLYKATRLFDRIATWSARAQELVEGLSEESAEDERAVALDAATGAAAIAMDSAAGAVQGWFAGDDEGLPVPEVTEADFPVEFKYS